MIEIVRKNHALKILSEYNFQQPFFIYLKSYFAANRQMGSKDRKFLRNLTFNYFRIGNGIHIFPPEKALLIGNFLAEEKINSFLSYWLPLELEINPESVELPLPEKLAIIDQKFQGRVKEFFPLLEELSDHLDKEKYFLSLFNQPPVYLRLRRGKAKQVIKDLEDNGISYELLGNFTVKGEREKNYQGLSTYSKGYFEIQDINSSGILEKIPFGKGETWWDCCAGSGGKCLAAMDSHAGLKFLVSDKRTSILRNLEKRFKRNSLKAESIFQLDLTQPITRKLPAFDGVILDAPCSGSGTWARTPENIGAFKKEKLQEFTTLQENIILNLAPQLKKEQLLVYITCSVFKAENEMMISSLKVANQFETIKLEYLKGYEMEGETLFIALLKKK